MDEQSHELLHHPSAHRCLRRRLHPRYDPIRHLLLQIQRALCTAGGFLVDAQRKHSISNQQHINSSHHPGRKNHLFPARGGNPQYARCWRKAWLVLAVSVGGRSHICHWLHCTHSSPLPSLARLCGHHLTHVTHTKQSYFYLPASPTRTTGVIWRRPWYTERQEIIMVNVRTSFIPPKRPRIRG